MRSPTVVTAFLLWLLVACGSPPVPPPPEPPPPEPIATATAEPDEPPEVATSGPDCPEPQQADAGACAIELDSPKESSTPER